VPGRVAGASGRIDLLAAVAGSGWAAFAAPPGWTCSAAGRPGLAGVETGPVGFAVDAGTAGRGVVGAVRAFAAGLLLSGADALATGLVTPGAVTAAEPSPEAAGRPAAGWSSGRREAVAAWSALLGCLVRPTRPESARVRPVAAHPGDEEPPNRAFRGVASAGRAALAGATASAPTSVPAISGSREAPTFPEAARGPAVPATPVDTAAAAESAAASGEPSAALAAGASDEEPATRAAVAEGTPAAAWDAAAGGETPAT
jgi:hypothetical protein